MGQIRYHDYLSEIRSKKASEAVAIPVGIGPLFGYNVIFYDGTTLLISADDTKNFRHNLTNERNVLVNPKSACITPDGILTLESSELEVPLSLGKFTGVKEVALIATHLFSKQEGGTITSYRVYVNPDQQDAWTPKLKQSSSTMETWLSLLSGTLRRNQEVVLAMFSVEVVGEDYLIKDIMNPYNYLWGETDYVPLSRYEADMANLNLLIPKYDSRSIGLSNFTQKVSKRKYTNGTLTQFSKSNIVTIEDPGLTLSTLGDAINLIAGIHLDFSSLQMSLEDQLVAELSATMDYIMPTPLNVKFQTPVAFNWLRNNSQNEDTGEKIQQTNYSVYGLLNMYESNFQLVLQFYPVGDQDTNPNLIASDVHCKADFTMDISRMISLVDMYDLNIEVVSAEGTTGSGEVTGAGRYKRGSLVTIVASPASGSGFVGWYEGDALISNEQVYRIEVKKNTNLKAIFNGSSTKVKVSVTVNPAGKATISGEGMYSINTQATLQCVPVTGYGFDYWEIDGVRYTINPLTFGVTKTTNVICKLVPPKRDLTLLGSPSGIFQLSGAGAYSVNDPVTVKANLLSQDYEFAGWYRDSVIPSNLISTNATHSFNMPDQDLVLYASANEKIVENYFEIRVSSGAGGTTSPAGVNSYKEGTTIRITAQPASGYSFLEWRAGGPSGIKLDYPASFQHTVTGDYYFYALFMKDEEPEPEQVLIKTNSDRGGLTEPVFQYYAKGSRVTITATPWSGYNFVEWRLGGRDGQVVSRSASYTFTANSSATYWAVFEEKPEETYPVHIKVSTDGKCQYVLSHSTASGGSQVPDTGVTSVTTTKDWNLPKGAVIQVVGQDGSSKFNRWEYTVNGEYTATTDHQVQFVVPGALDIDIKAVSKEDPQPPQPPQQTVKVSLSLTKNNTPSIGDINIYRNGSIMGTHKLSSLPLSFPAQTFVVGDKLHIGLPGVVVTRIRTAHQVSGDYRDYTDSGNTSRDIAIEGGSTIISWAIEGKG
jgi:hypothetical protein